MRRYYPALIHTLSDGSVQASFPDFPDLTCRASTLDSLHASAQDMLGRKVVDLFNANRALPLATPITALPQPADGERPPVVTLLPIVTSSRKQKVNLMLEEGLLRDIDLVATSRSAFIDEAIRFRLAADVGLAQQETGNRPAPEPTPTAAPEPPKTTSPLASSESPDSSMMAAPLSPAPEPTREPIPEAIPQPTPQPGYQAAPSQAAPDQTPDDETETDMGTIAETAPESADPTRETNAAAADGTPPLTAAEEEPQPVSHPS